MPRFFVLPEQIKENKAEIIGEDAHHIKTVLRSRIGDRITVCDGCGMDYEGRILELTDCIILEIDERKKSLSEPKTKITLYQGLPKSDKMEMIIQKCVEIGVHAIVPVSMERSIVKMTTKDEKKRERWQKISVSAAKQSGRAEIPQIEKAVSFQQALQEIKDFDAAIFAYEKEEKFGIRDFITKFQGQSLAVMIGPEGGFSEIETELAKESGVYGITLGPRILRTETAGLVTLSILLYELG